MDSKRAAGNGRAGRVAAALQGVFEAGADLLYPPHCMACGIPLERPHNGAICEACLTGIEWIGADRCLRCGERAGQGLGAVESCAACLGHPPVFVKASCAVAHYGDPLRALILGLKFGAGMQAVPLLAQWLARRIEQTGLAEYNGPVALVPVPMNRWEFGHRGFNQAGEIARLAARRLRLPVEMRLLRKIKRTRKQATLGREARRTNMAGAFAADARRAKRYALGCVILVDDVMTTCSTAGECAKTLVQAGVKEVRGAFTARG